MQQGGQNEVKCNIDWGSILAISLAMCPISTINIITALKGDMFGVTAFLDMLSLHIHFAPYFILQAGNAIPVNVIMFLPAMALGCLGGVFGALFTITNLKMARLRRRVITRIRRPSLQKLCRFAEPLIIMVRW